MNIWRAITNLVINTKSSCPIWRLLNIYLSRPLIMTRRTIRTCTIFNVKKIWSSIAYTISARLMTNIRVLNRTCITTYLYISYLCRIQTSLRSIIYTWIFYIYRLIFACPWSHFIESYRIFDPIYYFLWGGKNNIRVGRHLI